MKRIGFTLTLLLLLSGFWGCKGEDSDQRSKFFSTYSTAKIVEKNKDLLLPGPRELSGIESGPAEFPFQRHEEMTIDISGESLPQFMTAIRSAIEDTLASTGARIEGGSYGSRDPSSLDDVEYFILRYATDGNNGIVNVWGVRGAGTTYHLIVLITES